MPEEISNMVDAVQQGGPGCSDSETEAACGVEARFSALQSFLPPPQLKKLTRKRMPEKISNMVDAIQQGGPGCADSETEAARGVEEFFSAPQSLVPPPQLKKSTRKQDEAEVACSGGHPGCADVETDEVHGVEGKVSALQSLIYPPEQLKSRHHKRHHSATRKKEERPRCSHTPPIAVLVAPRERGRTRSILAIKANSSSY